MVTEKMFDEFWRRIDGLAKPASIVWESAMKQVMLEGITNIVVSVLLLIAGFILWRVWRKVQEEWDSWDRGCNNVLFWILISACWIAFVSTLSAGIFRLLNPVVFTIKKIISG
jgi:hypothetical protein